MSTYPVERRPLRFWDNFPLVGKRFQESQVKKELEAQVIAREVANRMFESAKLGFTRIEKWDGGQSWENTFFRLKDRYGPLWCCYIISSNELERNIAIRVMGGPSVWEGSNLELFSLKHVGKDRETGGIYFDRSRKKQLPLSAGFRYINRILQADFDREATVKDYFKQVEQDGGLSIEGDPLIRIAWAVEINTPSHQLVL